MIARIWHGTVAKNKYKEYEEFLIKVAVPDYERTEGFVKLVFLKKLEGEIGHFTLITFWKNLEVIKNFAGEEYEKAKYYPEDNGFLLKFEEEVVHHEVFAGLL